MLETKITVPPNLGKALAALKPEELLRVVAKGMVRGTLLIAGRIQRERFTGKGPFAIALKKLGVITGRARQSITASPQASIVGDAVQTSIGSNVSYVKAHEFGFKGRVSVKAHEVTMTKLFGRKLKAPLRFSRLASTRSVNIPERAMIRTGIKEHIITIYRETQRELTSAMKRQ